MLPRQSFCYIFSSSDSRRDCRFFRLAATEKHAGIAGRWPLPSEITGQVVVWLLGRVQHGVWSVVL